MFKPGDTVLYGNEGVCKIVEITEKSFGDFSAEYFVMQPVFNNRSTFFVPTKNEKLLQKMHPVLNADELIEIVSSSSRHEKWIDNDSIRRDTFKNIIQNGEFSEIVSLLKTLMHHKEEIEANGKKLHKSDEIVFKEAQKILYEEFAMVTKLEKDDVLKFITDKKLLMKIK